MTPPVEVTTADRKLFYALFSMRFSLNRVRDGRYDDDWRMQAIAAHRANAAEGVR